MGNEWQRENATTLALVLEPRDFKTGGVGRTTACLLPHRKPKLPFGHSTRHVYIRTRKDESEPLLGPHLEGYWSHGGLLGSLWNFQSFCVLSSSPLLTERVDTVGWNSMSEGPSGYTAYSHVGWGAAHGEQQKRDSWSEAIRWRRDQSAGGVVSGCRGVMGAWHVQATRKRKTYFTHSH